MRQIIFRGVLSISTAVLLLCLLSGCASTSPGGGEGKGSSILPWSTSGVKIGYIRSDVISQRYTDYRDADNALRADNRKWLEEAEEMEKEINRREAELEDLSLILSTDRKERLQQELVEARRNLQKFRHETWYDENSSYIKRRRELMESIDARVNDAIWKVAKGEGFDVVFDTVAGNIVYVKPEMDLTEKVLEELED